MIVKYYKDDDLKYAGRKRFKDISSYSYIKEEEQKSLLINDGATCTVKTSNSNICDYVTIEDDDNNITRWFVTSYVYLNGGQVELYLQRDVIGEFGIKDIYAKIERGYTDTVLRNRKELNLNEVLKKRHMLIPNNKNLEELKEFGNYKVDNLENSMWGVIYLNKPKDEDITIPIEGFTVPSYDYSLRDVGSKKLNSFNYTSFARIYYKVVVNGNDEYYFTQYISRTFDINENGEVTSFVVNANNPVRRFENIAFITFNVSISSAYTYEHIFELCKTNIKEKLVTLAFKDSPSTFDRTYEYSISDIDYTGLVIKNTVNDITNYYKYSSTKSTERVEGEGNNGNYFRNILNIWFGGAEYDISNGSSTVRISTSSVFIDSMFNNNYDFYDFGDYINYTVLTYDRELVNPSDMGTIIIDKNSKLVDEPFLCFVTPLYDVEIENFAETENYKVEKFQAFNVFNDVINGLSGENGHLIDAQIYPYCPDLGTVSFSTNDTINNKQYPYFSVIGNTFTRTCFVDLEANEDVKKEYITKKYNIVSPENSGNFSFNFYDYKLTNTPLEVSIKTALKPFSIVTSAVIVPEKREVDGIEEFSLKGMTFDDDMRGCNPSANGFQCSLSSNAFETYKRQNANYQQIFALQQEELSLQHATELVNEQTSRTVNTLSASAMGAIGGAAAGQAIGGRVGAAIGAGIVGTAAGITTNIAMNKQIEQNEKLREFERDLQSQMFNLNIGTIKALPNSVNRISSFNEILLNNFWYCIEVYECTEEEKKLVDDFIEKYGYGLGVYGYLDKYHMDNWFLRGTIVTSLFPVNLANIASNELKGGIYYNE